MNFFSSLFVTGITLFIFYITFENINNVHDRIDKVIQINSLKFVSYRDFNKLIKE
jgi:hypothetical protein